MDNLIREYELNRISGAVIAIRRGRSYCHQFDHFLKLVKIAKKDFPMLKDSEIEIVKYESDRIKQMWGIEFKASVKNIPGSYSEAILEFHI